MIRPVFLIDVDQVLADFVPPAIEAMSQVLGRPWSLDEAPPDEWDMFTVLSEKEQEAVDAIIDAPGWCSALKPIEGSREAVEELRRHSDVYVVTAHRRKAREWVYERERWLVEHFGFDRGHIVHTGAKYLISGGYFLDDHPGKVVDWTVCNPRGVGMVWSTEHNRRLKGFDAYRVYSWQEVINKVVMRWTSSP